MADVIILGMNDQFSHKGSDGGYIRKVFPAWVAEPIWACATKKDELQKLLVALMHGAVILKDLPLFFEEWFEEFPEDRTEDKLRDEELKARADFVSKEADKGYPTLHGHVLVALWAVFEVFIEDLLVGMLINMPEFPRGVQPGEGIVSRVQPDGYRRASKVSSRRG